MQQQNQVPGPSGQQSRALLRRRVSRRFGFRQAGLLALSVMLLGGACGGGDDDDDDDEQDDEDD